ncbi:GlsB/YeaQ/YmgE family stress response membrane protein [Saccharothrix coeruleofusca]|uniref:Membrane protein n=1 Tax=Saccharothrix coeruleofusca TaxID=33919 RepID=A0A918AHU3_9PSEU|nr:GlsB/YeaQ/YmgE family stress response membrane protein [Saccharothrix coeruleofusca]MBP2334042.1 putative membrane protein YeaQ/YmgE (transglycosylase-associated protein family) [Saccharothrix coeruleofusca]GGP43824.1 membrane protein [Saccharothrix coeruleofusca]
MEITGIISALFIGLLIGGLGRLVVPGKQRISVLLTVLVGIAAALVGTFGASVIGVAETDGIDWIELALQVGLAGVGVTALAKRRSRQLS